MTLQERIGRFWITAVHQASEYLLAQTDEAVSVDNEMVYLIWTRAIANILGSCPDRKRQAQRWESLRRMRRMAIMSQVRESFAFQVFQRVVTDNCTSLLALRLKHRCSEEARSTGRLPHLTAF